MASVSRDPEGKGYRIQFTAADGTRKTLRLPVTDRRAAEAVGRHIDAMITAKLAAQPIPRETALWLGQIAAPFRQKLAKLGLIEARPDEEEWALGPFLEDYIHRRPDISPGTRANMGRTVRVLLAYFGKDRPLRSISKADAKDWERWLFTPAARVLLHEGGSDCLAVSTIRRRVGMARQFFKDALERGLIDQNPFVGLSGSVRGNAAKRRFITREDTQRLLEACPNSQWRLLVGLARYGGLRVPSESHGLTWADIDWQRKRIRVRSPKTARHPGHEAREIPLFPELEPLLLEAWEACPEGEPRCIYTIGPKNPGVHLKRLAAKAGLPVWPKPFVNLRASRATELAAMVPGHVAASWLGHSPSIADEHYRMVLDEHYQRAVCGGLSDPPAGGTSSADPAGQIGLPQGGPPTYLADNPTHEPTQQARATVGDVQNTITQPGETYPTSPGISPYFRVLHPPKVGGRRFEHAVYSQGKLGVADQTDAQIDVSMGADALDGIDALASKASQWLAKDGGLRALAELIETLSADEKAKLLRLLGG